MQIVVEKAALSAALARAAAFAETKGEIEVLKHCRLAAEAGPAGGGLTVSANGLVLAYEESLACETVKPGRCLPPAKRLADLVAAAPEGAQITLSAGDKFLSVSDGRGRYRLSLWPDDLPLFPDLGDTAEPGDLPPGFLASLKRISPSIGRDQVRPYLNCVALEMEGGEAEEGEAASSDGGAAAGLSFLRLTATDGATLQSTRCALAASAKGEPWQETLRATGALMLPEITCRKLGQAFADEETLALVASDTRLIFEGAGRRVATKLVDGVYPAWRNILPRHETKPLTCDRKAFAHAIKRIGLVASEAEGGSNAIYLHAGKGSLMVVGDSAHAGGGIEQIEADYEGPAEGDAVSFCFNQRALSTIVESCGADSVIMDIGPTGSNSLTLRDETRTGDHLLVATRRELLPAHALDLAA